MARKGSRKVKTGCLTCKIRKVKCDEAKPFCDRCTKTGRKCDGYPTPAKAHSDEGATSELSEQLMLWNSDSSSAGSPGWTPKIVVSQPEARALDFFHNMVAPSLSGNLESKFWTHFVTQVSQQEPSVRHAATAISTLYEQFGKPPEDESNAFAIQQYNQSIKELVSNEDERVVLLVCIMMICIEFLRGNVQVSIAHCRHGVSILNSSNTTQWTRDNILPVFCRLSIFPFFFGCTPDTFPLLDDLESLLRKCLPSSNTTLGQLQGSQDIILCRAIRFVRQGDSCRTGETDPIPESYLAEQRNLEQDIGQWEMSFKQFKQHRSLSGTEVTTCFVLEMRHILTSIWVNTALEDNETAYDRHLGKFQAIINLATIVMATSMGASRPKFIFEMGFLPLLYFVAIKCRDFRTRLAALQSIRALSVNREILWDVDVMYSVARNVIEMEHGIRVDGIDPETWQNRAGTAELERVMEMYMEPTDGVVDVPKDNRRVSFAFRKSGAKGFAFREKVIAMRVFKD